jgi:hypothetical protein
MREAQTRNLEIPDRRFASSGLTSDYIPAALTAPE